MKPTPSQPLFIDLPPGRRHSLQLQRGASLVVLAGPVWLEAPPRWIGELRLPDGSLRIDSEGHHVAAEPGYAVLTAGDSAARVRVEPAPEPALARAMRGLLQRLHGALRGARASSSGF